MSGTEKVTIDTDIRDPNEINRHVKVTFEDAFGEPSGVRSIECVWINTFKCFECSKNLCYRLISLFCGLCIAMGWGCHFAVATFLHIWCLTPLWRMFAINMACLKQFLVAIIDCCLSPVCDSFSFMFKSININK